MAPENSNNPYEKSYNILVADLLRSISGANYVSRDVSRDDPLDQYLIPPFPCPRIKEYVDNFKGFYYELFDPYILSDFQELILRIGNGELPNGGDLLTLVSKHLPSALQQLANAPSDGKVINLKDLTGKYTPTYIKIVRDGTFSFLILFQNDGYCLNDGNYDKGYTNKIRVVQYHFLIVNNPTVKERYKNAGFEVICKNDWMHSARSCNLHDLGNEYSAESIEEALYFLQGYCFIHSSSVPPDEGKFVPPHDKRCSLDTA